jgi:hypothetical protein
MKKIVSNRSATTAVRLLSRQKGTAYKSTPETGLIEPQADDLSQNVTDPEPVSPEEQKAVDKAARRKEFEIVASVNVYRMACERVGVVPKKRVQDVLGNTYAYIYACMHLCMYVCMYVRVYMFRPH